MKRRTGTSGYGRAQGGRRLTGRALVAGGALLVAAGALLDVHPFLFPAQAEDMERHTMNRASMYLLLVSGLVAACAGTFVLRPRGPRSAAGSALVGTRLTRAHLVLMVVGLLAVAIDAMKPAAIAFVLPGMREEYGLSSGALAMLPLAALGGTCLGAALWGVLADRVGRRPALDLAAILFVGTSGCGVMPTFQENVLMCFFMGLSAGGLLPVMLTLVAETVPTLHRGTMSVAVALVGATGGYLAVAAANRWLVPQYGWRILWLIGLPTGALLLLLIRGIPESPRFLSLFGPSKQLDDMQHRFALALDTAVAARSAGRGVTAAAPLATYAVCGGLISLGFLTWLPTMLAEVRVVQSSEEVAELLLRAALISLPVSLLVAWAYGRWSSKGTLLLAAGVTLTGLLALATMTDAAASKTGLGLMVVLTIVGAQTMTAAVVPYAAEHYATRHRARASGWLSSINKLGGLVGAQLVGLIAAATVGPRLVALMLCAPLLAAILFMTRRGLETRGALPAEL